MNRKNEGKLHFVKTVWTDAACDFSVINALVSFAEMAAMSLA
jgi:hypothetical protein